MARSFVRTSSHKVTTSIGALGFAGPLTIAAIVKRASNTNQETIFRAGSGAAASLSLYIKQTTDKLTYWNQTTDIQATTLTLLVADGWCLVAVTKASGTTTPRFHKYVFSSNTWTHDNGTGTIADPGTPATNAFLGANGSVDYWDGDIEIIGSWNTAMSDAQIETLAFNLSSWFQVTPKGIWPFYQQAIGQKVLDITGGGANESAITGTTVGTSSVPVFSYGLHVSRSEKQPAAAVGGTTSPRDLLLLGAG